MSHRRQIILACLMAIMPASSAFAANYGILSNLQEAFPGQYIALWAQAETTPGDNVVGYGYLSFAMDLSLTGSASVPGSAVSGVSINTMIFNDTFDSSTGFAQGSAYQGIAGVTTDLSSPNAGSNAGDVVRLFDFGISVPPNAIPGSYFTITPSEGFLQSLTVNPNFDPVDPQNFESLTITIIPEPSVMFLVALLPLLRFRRKPK